MLPKAVIAPIPSATPEEIVAQSKAVEIDVIMGRLRFGTRSIIC
jgi:hypothetical protein